MTDDDCLIVDHLCREAGGVAVQLNREAARLADRLWPVSLTDRGALWAEASCEEEPWEDVRDALHAMWRESLRLKLPRALTDEELELAEGYDEWLANIRNGVEGSAIQALRETCPEDDLLLSGQDV